MGSCNSTICESSDLSVEADSDVAGIGVLVAFATSAVLALLAITFGYLSDSMPENTLTELDEYLVTTPLRTRFTKLKHAISKICGTKQKAKKVTLFDDNRAARTRRQDGLEHFLLTLSDQQLVTGLAVLIAGFLKMCSMSNYHFNIVGSLAWFSSTTHLATLGVLRNYLVAHSAVRDWRVLAMGLVLVMLLVAQLPGWTSRDSSVPIFCCFLDLEIDPDFSDVVTLLTTLGFLTVIYIERIARLYSPDLDWNVSDSLIDIFVKLLSRNSETPRQKIARNSTGLSKAGVSRAIRAERERIRYNRFELAIKKSRGRFRSYFLAVIFIADEYSYSFISQITVLIFNLTYGFTYTLVFRSYTPGGGITGNQNEMGFGQLVPLFLLLLPGLSVGEVYFESQTATDTTTNNAPSEDALPSTSIASPLQSSEVNVHSNDIPMSEIDEQSHPDIVDAGNSQSGTHGSTTMQSHNDTETHLTALEKLLESLNSPTFPLPTPDMSSSDEDGNERLRALSHTSTGIALGQYQNYQADRPEIPPDHPQAEADTGNEEVSAADDSQSAQSKATTAVPPSPAGSSTPHPDQQPPAAGNTQSHQPRTIPNPYYSGLHYRRILACVISFVLGFQVLFALALGGVFGGWGYSIALLFLLALLAVSVCVVLDGTRQEMLEIKRGKSKT